MTNVHFLKLHEKAQLPFYATAGAAGADVCSVVHCDLEPGERVLVPTGLGCEIPAGFEIQVRPRSGLAFKNGVTVLNSPGTIDSDYKGEIVVIMINLGEEILQIEPGMRVAQIVVAPVIQAKFGWVEEQTESARGTNGFGSTGLK